jgi:predicted oxidoreductase
MWFDARGNRLPVPLFPGFDTLGTLEYIMKTGYDHTWFVLTQRTIEREFVLSGSDQNPDLTGKNILMLLKHALTGASAQIKGFMRDGIDFVVERNLRELVNGMNRITDEPLIDLASLQREIEARDREIANSFTKDSQITAIRGSRKYLGDKLARTVKPHRLLDPKAGPLIAVRLNIVTRKTLGGVETDLAGRVISDNHEPLPGLYAAGEVAGFGGGGVHGYRALEGTFLGGCLFSGRAAGRAVAAAVR